MKIKIQRRNYVEILTVFHISMDDVLVFGIGMAKERTEEAFSVPVSQTTVGKSYTMG